MLDITRNDPPIISDLFGRMGVSPFMEFYAEHVAFRKGARLRSTSLHAAYCDWARQANRPALGFRHLAASMAAQGHAHRKSSMMFFADAELLDQPRAGAEASERLVAMQEAEASAVASDRLASILRHLDDVRAEVISLRRQLGLA